MSICLKEIQLTRLSSEMPASLAVQAAVLEAAATRKPGLVCMDTQGVHTDMDIRTLTASAAAICAEASAFVQGIVERDLTPLRRTAGDCYPMP